MMVKKFKHPVVQFAHENPLLFALFGTTIFFYAPARIIGKAIRTAKYGDSSMGNIPGLMNERDSLLVPSSICTSLGPSLLPATVL